jgi:quercetin dioxygenase-like cupin family protein
MKFKITLLCAVVSLFAVTVAMAQDAAKVDPKHYKVEAENDQVRVLRVHYGPGEKSVMHSHPGQVVVYLTDGTIRFHMPDGKSQDATGKAGETQLTPAVVHDPENTGKTPFDAIVVELKHGASAHAKPAGKAAVKEVKK